MRKYLSNFGIPVPASFSAPLVLLAVFGALLLKRKFLTVFSTAQLLQDGYLKAVCKVS